MIAAAQRRGIRRREAVFLALHPLPVSQAAAAGAAVAKARLVAAEAVVEETLQVRPPAPRMRREFFKVHLFFRKHLDGVVLPAMIRILRQSRCHCGHKRLHPVPDVPDGCKRNAAGTHLG